MFSDPIAFTLILIGFIFFLGFLFSHVSNDYIDVFRCTIGIVRYAGAAFILGFRRLIFAIIEFNRY